MSHASIIVALSPSDLAVVHDSVDEALAHQLEPFNEDGHWFRDGSRWDWWVIGGRYSGKFCGVDQAKRGDLDVERLQAHAEAEARSSWALYQADLVKSPEFASLWGYAEGDTEASVVERARSEILSAYAFLRDRRWCEAERLGWFGMDVSTECEMANPDHDGSCTHKDEETGAMIMNWSEGREQWDANYWRRFIQNLSPDTLLVCVDYHV